MSRLSQIRPAIVKHRLVHPGTGEFTGVTLHIIGKDSGPHKKILQEFLQDKEQRSKDGNPITIEDGLAFARRLICAHVIDWEEEVPEGETPDPYTPEKLDALLKTGEYDWVAEQVNRIVDRRESFYTGSLNNSVSA